MSGSLASPALAAPRAEATVDAEVLARTATELFRLKQFERAAQLFMQAYAKSHKPALVFNAARAFQEAGKFGDAAGLFRLYLTISSDPEGIADAKARLQECESQAAAPPPPPPPAVPTAPPPAPAPAQPPPPPAAPPPPAPAAAAPAPARPPAKVVKTSARPAPPSQMWAWVATGAAAAVAVGGASMLAIGANDANAANADRYPGPDGPARYEERFEAAQGKWNVGAGLTAVAVASAGVATWLWLRSPEPATSSADAARAAEAVAWAAGQAR
ncbi:MAG: hypothetical protein HY902_08945 [Deltaproteobacteria bacterium]|nr:hypothetical protein [Deltaproteobacteria bacterium]